MTPHDLMRYLRDALEARGDLTAREQLEWLDGEAVVFAFQDGDNTRLFEVAVEEQTGEEGEQ